MDEANIYTVGGTVQAGGGIYISRQADEELLKLCRQRVFAYVLTPRQMGKSSLMVRTAEKLSEEDIQSIIIDLTQLGVQVTAEQWYLGLLTIIEGVLMLDTDVVQWWQAHTHLGLTQRLTLFVQKVLLVEVTSPVVIFVDEIDTTLSLNFTDDFYAAIRYFYVARSLEPDFRRLSFVLIGVATPGDLIRDAKRTPFNIGQRVDLTDFTFEEAKPLAEGLGLPKDEAQQVLRWVLKWTGGHPYLTQRLCSIIREQGKNSWSKADVDSVVSSTFLGAMSEQDNNLQFVRDMLTKRAPDPEVLTTYREIRTGKRSVPDEEQSIVKSHLKLSGVVRRENAVLKVRNPIYQQVFDRKWINENLPLSLRDMWEHLKPALPYFLMISVFFALLAYWQGRQSQLREIEALNASAKASLLSNQQLEALTVSAEAGKKLRYVIVGVPTDLKLATKNVLGQAVFSTQEINRLEGHDNWVTTVSFSPDGKTIASASLDTTVKLWSQDGRLLITLSGHSHQVNGISFAPDGKTIASASSDKTIKIWRTSDGRLLRTINGHDNSVNSVSYSADGKTLVSASADKTIKLWNTNDGSLLKTLKGHSAGVISASFSPDGKTIASTSEDKTIKLWNSQDGRLLKTLNGHTNWVNRVSFSPDGKTLASASTDKTIILWNTNDGRLLKTLTGHTNSVISVLFSPDGKTFASAGQDNIVKLWSRNGIELETFKGHLNAVRGISFSPQGNIMATASADNSIKLWRRKDDSLLKIFPKDKARVYDVSISPDGSIIASTNEEGKIKLWRRNDSKLLRTISGHTDSVNSVSFNPQGSTIATASDDQTVKVWNVSDGRLLHTLIGHTLEVNSTNFSPDGKIIATGSRDKTVKLWHSSDGTLIKTLKGHNDEVFGVNFSHDGSTIATASADGTIKLWSIPDGRLLRTIAAHNNWVYDASFSPDDQIIASTGADKTIKLWRLSDGKLLRTLTGHTAEVYSSSFSPDGQTIASVSEDRTVKLWRLDGLLLKTLPENAAAVMNVSFSPDGKTFVSGSLDGTVKLWSFDPTDKPIAEMNYLMQRACNHLHDYLQTNPNVSESDRHLCDDIRVAK